MQPTRSLVGCNGFEAGSLLRENNKCLVWLANVERKCLRSVSPEMRLFAGTKKRRCDAQVREPISQRLAAISASAEHWTGDRHGKIPSASGLDLGRSGFYEYHLSDKEL